MKALHSLFAALIFLGFTASAQAELGVGVFGTYHLSDAYTFSGPFADKITAPSGTNYGALVFFPIFPYLSIRTGLAYETLKFKTHYTGGLPTTDTRLENMLIPLNLHFEFPIVGLYAFGGLVFVSNQKTTPNSGTKAQSDTRTNLGIGYDFFNFTLLTLSGELEYLRGSRTIAPNTEYELKTNQLNLNIMARFTL